MLIKNMTIQDQEILMKKTGFNIEKRVKYLEFTLINRKLLQNNVKIWNDINKKS